MAEDEGLLSSRRSQDDEVADWPYLRGFVGSYLHQDADITGGADPTNQVFYWNIVEEFLRQAPAEEVRRLAAEIEAVVALPGGLPDGFLEGLGMEVALDDQTPREFLLMLRKLLTGRRERMAVRSNGTPKDP